MKIVVLADLHGNMVATEAMERELERIQPDDVWFLGDAVGKGPESDKTIDWVRTHCKHWIAGNWDRVLSQFPDYNAFVIKQIGQERLDWLNSLPLEDELEISGLRFRLVHGRFLDPMYVSDDPDEKLREGFRFHDGRPEANGLICADTHTRLSARWRTDTRSIREASGTISAWRERMHCCWRENRGLLR